MILLGFRVKPKYSGNFDGGVALPAWRVGMSIGEWREITGTLLSSVPFYNYGATNEPRGKQDAWVGWSVDTRNSKVYSVANGGHADYYGNEVDVIELEADAPAWVELLTSSSQADVGVPSDSDHYLDLRPASRHSYSTQQFIEALNKAMIFGVGSKSSSGNPGASVDAFRIADNTFDAPNTYTSVPFGGLGAGSWQVAKHPTTEDVYCWNSNDGIYKWTRATGAWSTVGSMAAFGARSADTAVMAIDPSRGTGGAGQILIVCGRPVSVIHNVFDIGSGVVSDITLTGADAVNITGGHMGMVYEPDLDRFLFRDGAAGGTIYSINPSTFAVSVFSTTSGGSVPEAAVVSGGHSVNTRWLYVPRLAGIVYGPTWGENLWFLRTH